MVGAIFENELIDGEPLLWAPPKRHEGVRSVTPKHLKNSNGSSFFHDREVQHESELEQKVAAYLKAQPDIVELRSQFKRVEYLDREGKLHNHTIDYCARYSTGHWDAILVKMNRSRAKVEAVKKGMLPKHRAMFRDIKIMTELDVPWWLVANCEAIVNYREIDVGPHVGILLAELSPMNGKRVRFYKLYNSAVDRPLRTAAIWRLIDMGNLVPPISKINELSWLHVQL